MGLSAASVGDPVRSCRQVPWLLLSVLEIWVLLVVEGCLASKHRRQSEPEALRLDQHLIAHPEDPANLNCVLISLC